MFTHCTCSPAHETLNPNLDAQPSPAAQAHSPPPHPSGPVSHAATTPESRFASRPGHQRPSPADRRRATALRPPAAVPAPPHATTAYFLRRCCSRQPPYSRRPPAAGSSAGPPLLFSDRIHGGIRRLPLLPLPPRRAGEPAQLQISPSPQWPPGRPPHRHRLPLRPRPPPSYPLGSAPAPPSPNGLRQRHLHRLSPPAPLSGDLRQAGGRGAAASSPAPGRGAALAGAGVGWGQPPLLQAARGERIPAAVAVAEAPWARGGCVGVQRPPRALLGERRASARRGPARGSELMAAAARRACIAEFKSAIRVVRVNPNPKFRVPEMSGFGFY